MFLASAGKTPIGKYSTIHTTLLVMVVSAENIKSTAFITKICRNVKMSADAFAKDDYYLSAAVNFPTITPATIIYTIK